ncbi:Two component transcriptional regulator, AraC family [Hyella patelloides LEGE 07179]|uniref:Two component transcriptional regulator, AraC family n=1 Tax=Hyella patelloides LEGE 07179 TaxID=945734 RepID=A0A563VSG3_9CYAN|nr:helix-turn-helix domain-containing protein [Hyella patelloides]VEP14388.1 Two component transcriptional regulator, AraC family [Hyella patelloides LEGE 07179]
MTKVLVIENEEQTREMLLDFLELEGFKAIGAENGLVGVEKAHTHLPDITICDIAMPKLDGYGVLRTLRQNLDTAIIPLIFLTGRNTKQELRQGMELGASDYLLKPFTPEELLKAIAAQLKRNNIFQQWFAVKSEDIAQSSEPEIDEFAKFATLFASCSQLKAVYEFISSHYQESISLRDVAKHLGFSPGYLTKLVKDHTGEPINQWIIKRRVTAARSLLLETEQSVEQIAEAVGYQSINHFFRQFRQYYGASPKAWRKANRQTYFSLNK